MISAYLVVSHFSGYYLKASFRSVGSIAFKTIRGDYYLNIRLCNLGSTEESYNSGIYYLRTNTRNLGRNRFGNLLRSAEQITPRTAISAVRGVILQIKYVRLTTSALKLPYPVVSVPICSEILTT